MAKNNVLSLQVNDNGSIMRTTKRLGVMRSEFGKFAVTATKQGGKITTTLTKMPTLTQKVGSAFKSMGMQIIGAYMGITLIMQGLNGVVSALKESVTSFRQFETALAEVKTLLSGEEDFAIIGLGRGLEELSLTYGQSIKDLTEGMYQIISAAVPVEKSLNLLTTASRAAIAGISDVATSVDILTSILNAYGMQAEQMTEVSDKLFMTIKRGKLRFEDLANAMGYIAPIAANLGVELEEILAALSTVTRQGLHADMATRGLALAIQNIANISPQAAKAAEKYGVQLSGAALSVFGLQHVMKDLRDATQEYGMQIVPEMIRNMRSLRVVMALVGDEGIKGLVEDLNLLEEASGRTDKAMTDMMATTQKWKDISKQAYEEVARDIGEGFSGVDIWWEKTKTWWAALIPRGLEGANKALADIDKRFMDAARANLSWQKSSSGIGDMTTEEIQKAAEQHEKALDKMDELSPIQEALKDVTTLGSLMSGKDLVTGKVFDDFKTSITNVNEVAGKQLIVWNKDIHALDRVDDAVEQANTAFEKNEKIITTNANTVARTTEAYNAFKEPLIGIGEEILNVKKNMTTATTEIGALKDQIDSVTNTISDKMLSSFQQLASLTFKFGDVFTMPSYEYNEETFSSFMNETSESVWNVVKANHGYEGSLEDLVNSIGKVKRAEIEYNKVLEKSNLLIQRNNLALMKLQLKELQSRHGLRRSDLEKQKKLQIANLKERIRIGQLDLQQNIVKETSLSNLTNIYDEFVGRWSFQNSVLKGLYLEDYGGFKKTIDGKIESIQEFNTYLKKAVNLQKKLNASFEFYEKVEKGMSEEAAELTTYGIHGDLTRRAFPGLEGQNQRGTFSIPKTGLYLMHRQEEVTPKGSQRHGGGSINVSVAPINVNARITQETDIRAVGSKIGETIASGIITGINSEFEVG